MGFSLGLKPDEIMHMTLAEFNMYVFEYSLEKNNGIVILAWKIVNFVGLLFGGKLKDLKNYLPKIEKNKSDNNLSLREVKVLEAKKQAELLGHKI